MSGTGYAAIGHLLEESKAGGIECKMNALRALIYKLNLELDESTIHKQDASVFEKFFSEIDVSVESCRTFLTGFLKRHEVHELAFQRKVEKAVWGIVRYHRSFREHHEKYCKTDDIQEDICFHLFCLFNRFCSSQDDEMEMDDATKAFLFSKFALLKKKKGDKAILEETLEWSNKRKCYDLLGYVCKMKDTFVVINVRQAYDEYVRDILIEGCLECRVIGYSQNGKNERGKYPNFNNIFLYPYI